MGCTSRRILWLALVLSLIPTAPLAYAQSGGRFYPETGHTLEPQFVDFFDANGGVEIFGYPITDGFQNPADGTVIQYTENALFAWDAPKGQVQLQPLGELVGGWHLPKENPKAEGSGCRYFQESGHSTCFAFLSYYQAHGGRDLFGLPISDFIIQNDRIVQYFQYFRLDWYPDSESAVQVRVAPLGREHFRQKGYDPSLLLPAGRGGEGEYRVLEINPAASVLHPTVSPEANQEIYLLVRDQNQLPVQGASALLIAHLPERKRYFLMPASDEAGVSRRDLPLDGGLGLGKVNFEIWVMYAGLQEVTRDSFTIR